MNRAVCEIPRFEALHASLQSTEPIISDSHARTISLGAMKITFRSLSFLGICVAAFLTTSCSRSPGPASAGVAMDIVPGVGVGPIKFGMTMDAVKQALGEPDRAPGRALEYLSLGLAVIRSKRDGTVGAIMMGDGNGSYLVDRFKGVTKEGICMKSTRQEITVAYGEPESAESEDTGVEVLQYDSGRTRYTLKDGRLVHIVLLQLRR